MIYATNRAAWVHFLLLFLIDGIGEGWLMQVEAHAQRPNSATVKGADRMTPELLWEIKTLGDAVISPDGKSVAYTVRTYDLKENAGVTALHLLDVSTGKDTTIIDNWKSIASVQWHEANEQSRIYFEGTHSVEPAGVADAQAAPVAEKDLANQEGRGQADAPADNQAWYLDTKTHATVQVTSVEGGIANLKVSPDGSRLAFTAGVKMNRAPNEIYLDLPKADARIIDGLMYRHWDQWDDYHYSHIFVSTIKEKGCCGGAFDLMDGIKADCPVPPFGGAEQFSWSADGEFIAFTMKNVEDWARSTNSDVYVVKAQPSETPVNISAEMKGYDRDPVWSPDGKYIAFTSLKRPGFEADRARVMLYERASGITKELTKGLDQNAHQIHWQPDSRGIFFTSESQGTKQIFRLAIDGDAVDGDAADGDWGLTQLSRGRFDWSIADVARSGKSVLAKRMDMLRPNELFFVGTADGAARPLTHLNDKLFERIEDPQIEERYVQATDGKKIHTWVIYPPGFNPQSRKKWPMLLYCQGGPQSQVSQRFSRRWNFHLMAEKGYIVVAPNRRGLPGFGQKWNDQISKDWGGQAMQDLLSVADSVMAEPYIDRSKVAAVGASFGGYSVYWLMGHHEKRFSAMIAHCGVFNLESMYGATEELFFVDWDMGGPYWQSQELAKRYRGFSPHQFVKNWDAPLLVIHGQKDFRVPVTQGMEAFTAAQVSQVPSRFLYFPEEGHWVRSPQNSVLWHRIFFDWLEKYCPPHRQPLMKESGQK